MAAGNAGTIAMQVRLELTQMEKDSLEIQKKMDKLADKFKQQGQTAGKGFASAVRNGFSDIDRSAEKLTKNIGNSLAPQMSALQSGIKASQNITQDIAGKFKDSLVSGEKFTKGISDLNVSLGQNIASAVKPAGDFLGNLLQVPNEKFAQGISNIKGLLGEGFASVIQPAGDFLGNLLQIPNEKFAEGISNIKGLLGEGFASVIQPVGDFLGNLFQKTAGIENVDIPEGGNLLANAFGISEEKLGKMTQTGGAMLGVFDNISGAMLEISRQHAEEQMAIIEEALQSTLGSIEKARQEALIDAGFAVANNEENLEAQLEAAKRIGDDILIYQAERRLEEQRINDDFDAQAQAAEEEAAREKATIAFKMAKEEYALKMIQAVNAGVMAVMHALASPGVPWPIAAAFGAAAGTASGIQIGLLAKNPPKPPRFANSGIVPGNKYAGDRITALVDSGELILNRAHQDNIADQLTNNSTPVSATIFVMLDSREIAQSTVNLVNNGQYTIKARALA
jgi:hypothetical protein